jgi:hypothetical protein
MRTKKDKNERRDRTRDSVRKEMAKPRITRSARISELNLDIDRVPVRPSASMSGIVDKIIRPPRPSKPEKAQIAVDHADLGYPDLRIENTLIDAHGDDVKLKKGAHVEITVTAEPNR